MNKADCILENLDPMENLRVMRIGGSSIANLNFLLPPVVGLFSWLEHNWHLNDINLRHDVLNLSHHVLTFEKQVTEFIEYLMPLYEASKGPEEILRHMLNPASENPFDWNLFHRLFPPGLGLEEDKKEMMLTGLKHFLEAWLGDANNNEDDIPLD